MKQISYLVMGAVAASASWPAAAHHGFANHFDPNSPVRIEGTIESFNFTNPHATLQVSTVNEAGETVVWTCEMQSRNQLARKGVTQDSYIPGEAIVVEGVAARRDPLRCEFGASRLADGTVFVGRTIDERRTVFNLDFAEEKPATIEGNWIRKQFPGGGRTDPFRDRYTEAGAIAHEGYDELTESPVLSCRPGGPLKMWGQPGHPTEITRDGNRMILRHEFMDVVRVVDLTTREHPSILARRPMGHAVGWFEDETFVIESAGFSAGVLQPNGAGMMMSESLVLTERLTVDEEGDLVIEWSADDPEYFRGGPVTGANVMARTNSEVGRYNCE